MAITAQMSLSKQAAYQGRSPQASPKQNKQKNNNKDLNTHIKHVEAQLLMDNFWSVKTGRHLKHSIWVDVWNVAWKILHQNILHLLSVVFRRSSHFVCQASLTHCTTCLGQGPDSLDVISRCVQQRTAKGRTAGSPCQGLGVQLFPPVG